MFGLRVHVPEHGSSTPVADFTCRCGETRRARGEREITALTAHAAGHRETCTAVEPRPCEHCGFPTRLLSNGQNGYPAHPECRQAWETRKQNPKTTDPNNLRTTGVTCNDQCQQSSVRKPRPSWRGFRRSTGGDVTTPEPHSHKNDTALTTNEAARLAGVKPVTIRAWVHRGKLKSHGDDEHGNPLYWQSDVARAEKEARERARRNVGLRTVATQDIDDDEAVLVRLDCGHLKILSTRHAPREGRAVACFECAASSNISHIVATTDNVAYAA